MRLWPSRRKTQRKGAASVGVRYASSPLLAAPTPPWRSRLLLALLGLGSLLLVGRAVYIQIIGTDFYLKQGESRYARTFAAIALVRWPLAAVLLGVGGSACIVAWVKLGAQGGRAA